jgi:alkyl sulfatase BDS1-like metallo-beta-lactamase superfamily hydrolase
VPKSPRGVVSSGLGVGLPTGQSDVAFPTRTIGKSGETVTIDGLDFEFYLAPDSEAPAEMVFYLPERKALSMAETVNHLQHNVYTLRGAKIRDAGLWAGYIADAVDRWGDTAEVHFGPHTWPVWGNDKVLKLLRGQRDLYQFIHDQVARYANHGYRPRQIAEDIRLPDALAQQWSNRPYYGSFPNNVIATYVANLGWFNGNPVELARLPDPERGRRYVAAMGGHEQVLRIALEAYHEGDYRFVVDVLNNVVAYRGDLSNVNYLMGDAFEQLAYQSENALYRNWYLSAAYELRAGKGTASPVTEASPEQIAVLPLENLIEVLSASLDSAKAAALPRLRIALSIGKQPRTLLELSGGVLTHVAGSTSSEVDLELQASPADFATLLVDPGKAGELMQAGKVKYSGDLTAFQKLASVVDMNVRPSPNLVLTPPTGTLE